MRSYLVKRGLNIPNITIQYLYYILTLDPNYSTFNTQKYTGVASKLFQNNTRVPRRCQNTTVTISGRALVSLFE